MESSTAFNAAGLHSSMGGHIEADAVTGGGHAPETGQRSPSHQCGADCRRGFRSFGLHCLLAATPYMAGRAPTMYRRKLHLVPRTAQWQHMRQNARRPHRLKRSYPWGAPMTSEIRWVQRLRCSGSFSNGCQHGWALAQKRWTSGGIPPAWAWGRGQMTRV